MDESERQTDILTFSLNLGAGMIRLWFELWTFLGVIYDLGW